MFQAIAQLFASITLFLNMFNTGVRTADKAVKLVENEVDNLERIQTRRFDAALLLDAEEQKVIESKPTKGATA